MPEGFKILSITGTDGKSTTAWILYKLLVTAYGENQVFLSGNFEIPLSETVRIIREKGLKSGYIVLEVSSFMGYGIGRNLHLIHQLPHTIQSGLVSEIAIFTNFAPDHLDWHASMEEYFDSKSRLLTHSHNQLVHESVRENIVQEGIKEWGKTYWYSGESSQICGGGNDTICHIDQTNFR